MALSESECELGSRKYTQGGKATLPSAVKLASTQCVRQEDTGPEHEGQPVHEQEQEYEREQEHES